MNQKYPNKLEGMLLNLGGFVTRTILYCSDIFVVKHMCITVFFP